MRNGITFWNSELGAGRSVARAGFVQRGGSLAPPGPPVRADYASSASIPSCRILR
jgi:hypothetical protein